jgi:TonB family protein
MRYLIVFLILFTATAEAADNIYVITVADADVTLSNGIPLTIKKGSCFPFLKDDLSHTFAQLKVGASTFWIRKTNVSLVPKADYPRAAAKYADEIRLSIQIAKRVPGGLKNSVAGIADTVKTVRPVYPYADRFNHHEASGLYHLRIDFKTGIVTSVTVKQPTGFKSLDDSATSALRRWRWVPGTRKEVDIPMTFYLRTTREPQFPAGAIHLPTEL